MSRRRELEASTPERLAFKGERFASAPGVVLSWEALSVGMEAINTRHDAAPLRAVRVRTAAAVALMACAAAAHAQTIGVHLVSVHVPARDYLQSFNPGIYVRTESGLTAGVYRNSLGRTSVYAGFTIDSGRFSLTVGATTGYQKRQWFGTCPDGNVEAECWDGVTNAVLLPVFSPSVRLPDVAGFTPRLSFIPGLGAGSANAVHLSVEKGF